MVDVSRHKEYRRRPRSRVSWPVIVESGDRLLHGETLNVGPFGAKLRLDERLQEGSLATLHFKPPQGDPMDVQAIVWRIDGDGPVFFFMNATPAALRTSP